MIKILFLAANPKDTDRIRLDEEVRGIRERLRMATHGGQFAVEQEWAVRVGDVQGHLLRHQPQIVHFSGHGSRAGKIVLEDQAGHSKAVPPDALKRLFATLKDNIRCVVLNACFSEIQAKAIAESIECVVGMSAAIADDSAVSFAASFYQALGFRRDVQTAFNLGCGQIGLESLEGEDTPKLITAPGVDAKIIFAEITKEVSSLPDSSMRPSQASHPIDPPNNGCIATNTGTASIEITINRDFKSYNNDDQFKLMRAIADFLDITGDVRVIRKCPGSVKLTLELTPEQAERLLWAAKAGRFAEYGLIDAELIADRASPLSQESLTDITTIWSQISSAHTPGPEGQVAMNDLIGHHHDAVERYLRIKLRDKHLADEVLQEFWTKLLNHKLAGADSSKGRFRDYLRTVLHRLIIDHFRTKKPQSLPPGDILDPSSPDDDYERVWRETIIRRVWTRLDTFEVNTPKNRYATVLHLRAGNPEASIDELAQKLGEQIGSKVTPEAFRKTLQQGRAKFLELLEQELRETIHPAEPQDIEAEINELGLGSLYRRYSSKSDVGPDEVGPAEIGPAEIGPAEVGPAEVGPAECSPAEVGPAE